MTRVLIVEDEDSIIYLLENILRNGGYEVDAAKGGSQALEMLKLHDFDLVFLDIIMPDMNGEKTLIAIRKMNKEIPVVMCSGSTDTKCAVRCMKYGAFDYVTKPFRKEKVLKVAKKALVAENIASAGMEEAEEETASEGVAEFDNREIEEKKPTEAEIAVVSENAAAYNNAETEEASQWAPVDIKLGTRQGKRKLLLPAGILLFIGIAVAYITIFNAGGGEKLRIYSVKYNNPTALAFDGEYLWVSDWYEQTIYKHIIDEELKIENFYSFSEICPAGIAWGENCIWVVDSLTSRISCHNLDDALSIKKTYLYPDNEPGGIVFDGTYLWVCEIENSLIYKLLPHEEDLITIAKYRCQGFKPTGIFWNGENIWTVDSRFKKVYKHNMDKQLTVAESYKFPVESIAGIEISGIGWDGKNIWVAADKKPMIIRVGIKQLIKE